MEDEAWEGPQDKAAAESDGSITLSGKDFRLGKRIAGGYQTDIYRAGQEEEETLRFVVKRLKPELARDPQIVERFKQEAWLTKHLDHPNIVRTIDFGESGNTYYMLMEAVHGRDLDVVINMLYDRGGRCPAGIGVEIITQVCRALEYAHDAKDEKGEPINLVHRDISPTNVMLTWDGAVKLVDFGLAKLPSSGRRETESQSVVGKLTYQPPEALEGGKPNIQFDVYALGALLYELVAGRSPITGVWDLQTLVHKVKHEEPTPLNEIATDASEELTRVVHKAMAKDPKDRYANMADLLEDLEPVRSQYGTTEAVIEKFIGEVFERPGYSFTGRYQVSFRTSEIKARKKRSKAGAAGPTSEKRKKGTVRTKRRAKKKKKKRGGFVFFLFFLTVVGTAGGAWWFLGESGYAVPDPLGLWVKPPPPKTGMTPKGTGAAPAKAKNGEAKAEGEAKDGDKTDGETDGAKTEGKTAEGGVAKTEGKEGEPDEGGAKTDAKTDAKTEGEETAAGEATATVPGTGTVKIRCRGKSTITVDGKKRGKCPKLMLELPEGKHRIEVRARKRIKRQIEVKAGETLKVEASR